MTQYKLFGGFMRPKSDDEEDPCNPCVSKPIESSRIAYDGPNLPCTGIKTCDELSVVLQKLDNIICGLQDCCQGGITTTTTSSTTTTTTTTRTPGWTGRFCDCLGNTVDVVDGKIMHYWLPGEVPYTLTVVNGTISSTTTTTTTAILI